MKLASALLSLLSLALAACATDDEVCGGRACIAEVVCGPGTHPEVGVCVPDEVPPPCAAGTHAQDGTCVPNVVCGPGTRARGGECVPDAIPSGCPDGTHEAGGVCVPDVVCGPLTHAEGGLCLPDVQCEDDQRNVSGACAPDFGFEIRVVTPTVDGDGHSKIPVFVIGTAPDGSPARDRVVLTVSQGGGRLLTREVALSPVGNTVYYVPCNAAVDRNCVGTTTLTLALESAPSLALATAAIEITEVTGVGSPAPCLVGGNVLFFDGDGGIFNGTQTVTQARWSDDPRDDDWVSFRIDPLDPTQGLWWDVDLSTEALFAPLGVGVYNDAQRAAFADPGHPGLDVGGDGRGCNRISGRFQIHDYLLADGNVQRALITFEQRCEGSARVLRGCLNYERAQR